MVLYEFPGSTQLHLLPITGKQIRLETSIEVPIQITGPCCSSLGVTNHPPAEQSASVDQLSLKLPLIQQPGGIQLIAMGPGHHQHIEAGHHNELG